MRRLFVVPLVALLLGAGLAAPRPALSEPEPDLPNLFAYPLTWLIGPVTGELPDYDPGTKRVLVDGCLPEERAAGAERCLRFTTRLTNFDFAPLDLALVTGPSGPKAYQIVDGDYLPAGTFSADPVRGDVQLDDFYVVRMWRFDGRRKIGRPVATTGLRGLCPSNVNLPGSRESCRSWPGNGPRGPEVMIRLPWLWHVWYMGDVAGQYIDVSGVPDGLYVLEIEIDPKNHIRESYERDNTTCGILRLRGTEVDELRNDYCWPARTEGIR